MIAADTETRSFRWWDNPAFLGSWSNDGQHGMVAVLPAGVRTRPAASGARPSSEFYRSIKADRHLTGANTKFDGHMIEAASKGKVNIFDGSWDVEDISMKSRLVFGNRRRKRHGLKEIGVDNIDANADDGEKAIQARYQELTGRGNMDVEDAYYDVWRAFPEDMEYYAGKDATLTYQADEFLTPLLQADPKLWRLYNDVEKPVQRVLFDAEREGVHVDPEAVARLKQHYDQRDAEARSALQRELGFVPEGEGSEDRLRQALLDAGVPLTEVTSKTGELAVNRNALEKFIEYPAVSALFEFRRTSKFLQTYINPLVDKDHVHPTFNQAEAWTGRMSGRDPNMQNLPKRTEVTVEEDMRVRSVFVPAPGTEFIIADYESIEMFVLAYFLGVPSYRQLLADPNGDPHSFTAAAAAQVVGLPSNQPSDYLKSTPNRWFRDIAKQGTYSIVYGAGGPTIKRTFNKYTIDAGHPEYLIQSVDQAREIRNRIIDAIPGFRAFIKTPYGGLTNRHPENGGRLWQQLYNSQVTDGDKIYGYVRTLMGRKQWIQMFPEDKSYVALSGLIQGSAADIMKAAAIAVWEALRPYGGYPIMFVHDELVAQVELGWGERLKPLVVEAMENVVQINPPLRVEASVTSRSYAHHD